MCDGFQGFFFNYSLGGGTSTSFLKAMYESIEPKKLSFGLSIWPSPKDQFASVVEAYNAVFNVSDQLNHRSGNGLSVTFDNAKLSKLCTE